MKKLLNILLIGIFAFIVLGFSLYFGIAQNTFAGANLAGEAFDVIGSRSGTTTSPASFNNLTIASTTYPTLIGANTDSATYTFQATTASATPIVYLSFLGSNDISCDTATTTTIFNVVTTSQVQWFDAGRHLVNLAGSLTQTTGTTTFAWIPIAGQGIDITLNNLNSRCLAVETHASGTAMWAQLNLKGKI